MLREDAPENRGLSRRGAIHGMTWTAPVILTLVATPQAVASSNCTPSPTTANLFAFASGTLAPWTQRIVSGAFQNGTTTPIRFYASYTPPNSGFTAISNAAALVFDASGNQPASAQLTSPTFCLRPGTYTFRFPWRAYGRNTHKARLNASLVDADNNTTLQTATVVETGTVDLQGTGQLVLTLTNRKRVQFAFLWTLGTAAGSTSSDDIAVQAPTLQYT